MYYNVNYQSVLTKGCNPCMSCCIYRVVVHEMNENMNVLLLRNITISLKSCVIWHQTYSSPLSPYIWCSVQEISNTNSFNFSPVGRYRSPRGRRLVFIDSIWLLDTQKISVLFLIWQHAFSLYIYIYVQYIHTHTYILYICVCMYVYTCM